MNTCKTCAHWTVPNWNTGGMGTCCLHVSRGEAHPPKRPVLVAYGHPHAYIGTHETFGCNHHAAKGET